MFKLARKNYLREVFSGGGGCTGDCGQGRRCTCNPDREESAGKPTDRKAQLPNGKTMTREDIIRIAREAEIPGSWDLNWFDPYLERFANLVAAHEREECAKFCEEQYVFYGFDHVFAAGIRARVEK
jgi:hypothetical protein